MKDTTDCGCCAGTATDTPAVKFNRPGLPAIAYRIGRHVDFKATLLARLSTLDFPALEPLQTRRDDDYTIALCDAFATLADVLTFYQERIANECYLRTATERRSLLELARLIGYQLAPGVAASTALAFMLEQSPGVPALAARPVTIPVGTRVQSVPDPDQAPQKFETVGEITARVEWNASPAQISEPVRIAPKLTELYLAGTATQLQQGDAILLLSNERENNEDGFSNRWDVRWIESIEVDTVRNLTRVTWSDKLGIQWSPPSVRGVHVYALRQRAALFGHNAPDPRMIFNRRNPDDYQLTTEGFSNEWANLTVSGKHLDLDAPYPKIVRESWVVVTQPGITPKLYRVDDVTQLSRRAFGLSGRVTRIELDADPMDFDLREAQVLGQSEELTLAQRPLAYPVFGSTVILDRLEPNLAPGQLVAFSGKRQRVVIGLDPGGVSFADDKKPVARAVRGIGMLPIPRLLLASVKHKVMADPRRIRFKHSPTRAVRAGEGFVMLSAPERLLESGEYQAVDPRALDPLNPLSGILRWHLEDHDGKLVIIEGPASAFKLQPAEEDDEVISEVGRIAAGAASVSNSDDLDHTIIKLERPLAGCYDRATFTMNANVAPATHGETVAEIAGSGDASRTNQSFPLKQSPLTYISTTSDPSGRTATLQARINDLLWKEVPSLYGQGPLERVYTLRHSDDGKGVVRFGDGVHAARLPSGQTNVRLSYRKGLGVAGNLRTDQLTTLLTRPLGVKSVTNPSPSTGGQDPETLADARRNAPLRVLTLDRAVSIRDYADFSRAFAGVAKAHAVWITDGRSRGVYVTVAGPEGAAIPAGSDTHKNLLGALRGFGDRLLPLSVQSYTAAFFRIQAAVKVAAEAEADKVLAAVEAALRRDYGFDARDFGQVVSIDDAYATMQGVPGVGATNISLFYRSDAGKPLLEPSGRLISELPAVASDGSVGPAELLTLDPAPIELGAMP